MGLFPAPELFDELGDLCAAIENSARADAAHADHRAELRWAA